MCLAGIGGTGGSPSALVLLLRLGLSAEGRFILKIKGSQSSAGPVVDVVRLLPASFCFCQAQLTAALPSAAPCWSVLSPGGLSPLHHSAPCSQPPWGCLGPRATPEGHRGVVADPSIGLKKGGVFLKTSNVSLHCFSSRQHQAGRGTLCSQCRPAFRGILACANAGRMCQFLPQTATLLQKAPAVEPKKKKKPRAKGKRNCCSSSLETGWRWGGRSWWASCCGCGAPRPVSCSWHESRACSTLLGSNLEGVFPLPGLGMDAGGHSDAANEEGQAGSKAQSFQLLVPRGKSSKLFASQQGDPREGAVPAKPASRNRSQQRATAQKEEAEAVQRGQLHALPGGRQSQPQKGWVPPGEQGLSCPLGHIQRGER